MSRSFVRGVSLHGLSLLDLLLVYDLTLAALVAASSSLDDPHSLRIDTLSV